MANDLANGAPQDGNGQPFMGAVDASTGKMHAFAGGTLISIPNSPSSAQMIRQQVETIDGGLATIGTTTDSAWTGSGAGSSIALLKALYTLLNTGNANTAHSNPAGSGTALTTPPASTNAAADTALTFSASVNHWSLQNNSNQTIYYAMDASTTAVVSPTTPIYVLAPNAMIWWDWPVTVVHVYTTSAISVNGAVASSGLVLSGRV